MVKVKQIMPATPGLKARFYNAEDDRIEEQTVDILAVVYERGVGTYVTPMCVMRDGLVDDPAAASNFLEICAPGQVPMSLEEARIVMDEREDDEWSDRMMDIERVRESQGR
jgi:hypothetical protein